jgi:hypothetical protein
MVAANPSKQLYSDLCAGAGLRLVVSGSSSWGTPGYCAPYNCMQTADFVNSFWGFVAAMTWGWATPGGTGGRGEGASSLGLVAFDVHNAPNGGGELRRSPPTENGWGEPLIPLSGREL